jgi:O-antigen ligase
VLSPEVVYIGILVASLICVSVFLGPGRLWQISLMLWWVLLCSEQLFPRKPTEEAAALAGSFSIIAYLEPISWMVISCIAVMMFWMDPHPFRAIGSAIKLLAVYSALMVVSVLYSPDPFFSLIWSCKLALTCALLAWISGKARNTQQWYQFLFVTWLGFAFLAITAIAQAALVSQSFFNDERINALMSPVTVSEWAASLMLLSIVLYRGKKQRFTLITAALGAAVMIISGGKTAIVAGTVSAIVFVLLQCNIAAGLSTLVFTSGIGALVWRFNFLPHYLQTYMGTGNADTLTGRVLLWQAALPVLLDRVLFGNGFMSSRFIGIRLGIDWNPGQLHNFILDVLYCNGIIGLAILLTVLAITGVNLIRNFKRCRTRSESAIAAGFISLMLYVLVNGMTEASIGGRPYAQFMLCLAVISMSDALRSSTVRLWHQPMALHSVRNRSIVSRARVQGRLVG